MKVFENRVKQMLKEGKKTAGAWAQLASPIHGRDPGSGRI